MSAAARVSYGYGSGDGDGYGYGSGYGYGYGSGDGDGDGYGYGYGYGDGDEIGSVAGHAVNVVRTWKIVRVGCQAHTIGWWRQNWREIASESSVATNETEVERLLALAEGNKP